MKPFSYYQEKVGVDFNSRCPAREYKYYGYNAGEVREFDTLQNAKMWGKSTESVISNQEEIDSYWEDSREKDAQAFDLWIEDLRLDYGTLPTKVFDLCYNEAYERGHAYGHDEVASCMIGVVRFAEMILEAVGNVTT